MFAAILKRRQRTPGDSAGAGPGRAATESEIAVGHPSDVAVQETAERPAHRRNPVERAVLVPVGAALLAAEELLALAAALADAEKAGRELLHFEERGMRARAHVEHLLNHHRGHLADRLELRIEQTRGHADGLATKGRGFASKIRPQMPKH
jgi:hypothetical protein